jgi:hypothetical protein
LGGVALLVGGGLTAQATTTTKPAPSVFTGRAFDTCTAPSLAAMKAWKSTKVYGAAAVYVGGKNRGCAQPQLTAAWTKSVTASGWKLIPLYVGAQPSCQTSKSPEKMTTANAATLGKTDGTDAVTKATALGMKAGSTVYLDMEAYDIKNVSCNTAVLNYVRAWDKAVHAKNFWAGFYGFKSTSAAAIANATVRTDLPDAMWYGLYDLHNTTTTDWPFKASLWTGHRRAHQYIVNSKETRGGVTLTIDRDAWDAPVAIVAK